MFFILILERIGVRLYWDYTTRWFDMVLHFLGGFWQAMLFIWFFSIKDLPFLRPSLDPNDAKLIYKALFFVVLIGFLWEVFEFYAKNYIGLSPFDLLDSTSDMILDLLGGGFALLYFYKIIMPPGRNKIQSI